MDEMHTLRVSVPTPDFTKPRLQEKDMVQDQTLETTMSSESGAKDQASFVRSLWGVRYQVSDVTRAADFYVQKLGFHLDFQNLPAFGQVSSGNLKLILSGPGASGSRPMPDGKAQQSGGWNRVILEVEDLPSRIEQLKKSGLTFRNAMETGPGGRQILLEDPDGNPIELFEPAGH